MELNQKLIEWAGVNLVGVPEGCEPDFVHSLDACFKYLVPKLISELGPERAFEMVFRPWFQWIKLRPEEAAKSLCEIIGICV